MAEFTIKKSEVKSLKINYGDKSFSIPLQGSLTFKEARSLDTAEGTYSFFKKYVPKDVLENMVIEEYNQMVEIWKDESVKHSGKKLGES